MTIFRPDPKPGVYVKAPKDKATLCVVCRKRERDRGLLVCGTDAKHECDKVFSLQIRARGRCQDDRPEHKCRGVLQNAHGWSRDYLGTRWDQRQCYCLCAGAHQYYTHRPIEWDDFMRRKQGALYEEIRQQALHPVGKTDYKALLTEFGLQRYIETP